MFKKKSLTDQNPHIEIISKDLWAVRFSLIPMIPQINVTANYTNDLSKERFVLLESGLILLNKDANLYPVLKAAFIAVMKLNLRQIDKELNLYKTGALLDTTVKSMAYHAALRVECERKSNKKGGES